MWRLKDYTTLNAVKGVTDNPSVRKGPGNVQGSQQGDEEKQPTTEVFKLLKGRMYTTNHYSTSDLPLGDV